MIMFLNDKNKLSRDVILVKCKVKDTHNSVRSYL